MTRLKDLYEYLDYLDNCSDGQFLKFVDAMEKRGYQFVTQYVFDYDYPHVTHCKDCIHNVANRKTDPLDTADYSGIDIVCDYFMTDGQEPDDYCSKAERKEE